jgi:O-acetylhomoserine/O-acetylserine sulfhydrylase-like pyridoxal-dependent enzyme
MRFETLVIHAGPKADPAYGAVMTPIYQVSTMEVASHEHRKRAQD